MYFSDVPIVQYTFRVSSISFTNVLELKENLSVYHVCGIRVLGFVCLAYAGFNSRCLEIKINYSYWYSRQWCSDYKNGTDFKLFSLPIWYSIECLANLMSHDQHFICFTFVANFVASEF